MGIFHARLTLTTIERMFQQREWRYEVVDEQLITGFDGVPMILSVDERREILLLEAPLVPGRGMPGYRPAKPEGERDVGTYLSAVNYRLALGAFTRDHHDGEIRYECSVPASGGILTIDQLEQVIDVALAAMSVRGPKIVDLLLGHTTLRHALAELDNGGESMPPVAVV